MDAAGLGDVTRLLERVGAGDSSAPASLLPLVYDELRSIAGRLFASQRRDHTLQPTALVHEAYLKMVVPGPDEPRRLKDRAHFMGVAATAMRQILVNHARDQQALKRGGGRAGGRVTLADVATPSNISEVDVLGLHNALQSLGEIEPRQARVAELRFFASMSIPEVAEVLGVSKRTVELDWGLARVWLMARLDGVSATEGA